MRNCSHGHCCYYRYWYAPAQLSYILAFGLHEMRKYTTWTWNFIYRVYTQWLLELFDSSPSSSPGILGSCWSPDCDKIEKSCTFKVSALYALFYMQSPPLKVLNVHQSPYWCWLTWRKMTVKVNCCQGFKGSEGLESRGKLYLHLKSVEWEQRNETELLNILEVQEASSPLITLLCEAEMHLWMHSPVSPNPASVSESSAVLSCAPLPLLPTSILSHPSSLYLLMRPYVPWIWTERKVCYEKNLRSFWGLARLPTLRFLRLWISQIPGHFVEGVTGSRETQERDYHSSD